MSLRSFQEPPPPPHIPISFFQNLHIPDSQVVQLSQIKLLSTDNLITLPSVAFGSDLLIMPGFVYSLESKWAPDLANCSPVPGNFWQHKTQGLILRLCNETDNHKFPGGLRKRNATGLGHFQLLLPKQIISVYEIWTRSHALGKHVKHGLL